MQVTVLVACALSSMGQCTLVFELRVGKFYWFSLGPTLLALSIIQQELLGVWMTVMMMMTVLQMMHQNSGQAFKASNHWTAVHLGNQTNRL